MELLERNIDVIILQEEEGSTLRGHNDKLSLEDVVSNGNFIETLKLLAKYDGKIHDHLNIKVQSEHKKNPNKKSLKGRGSKITFWSNKSPEKLIHLIGDK